jgi:F-type H+-transporting ATPase subunit epsilon
MPADAIQLVIVTPERKLLSESVSEVTLPGADGELGILPGHAALISELGIGELRYRTVGGTLSEPIAVIRGFTEVLPDRVTVLAETAERPEEIDIERAKAALERAEKRIAAGTSATEMDWDRATAALQRALVRLKVAEYAPRRRTATVQTP